MTPATPVPLTGAPPVAFPAAGVPLGPVQAGRPTGAGDWSGQAGVFRLLPGRLPGVVSATFGDQVRKSAGMTLSTAGPRLPPCLLKSDSSWPVTVQPDSVPRSSWTVTVFNWPSRLVELPVVHGRLSRLETCEMSHRVRRTEGRARRQVSTLSRAVGVQAELDRRHDDMRCVTGEGGWSTTGIGVIPVSWAQRLPDVQVAAQHGRVDLLLRVTANRSCRCPVTRRGLASGDRQWVLRRGARSIGSRARGRVTDRRSCELAQRGRTSHTERVQRDERRQIALQPRRSPPRWHR